MDYFNIQIAARISGISAHTIRAWEKRYQSLSPKRCPKGRRLYTKKEINRLQLLAEAIKLGNSIGQIAKKEDHQLQSMIETIKKGAQKAASHEQEIPPHTLKPYQVLENLTLSLEAHNAEVFYHELKKASLHMDSKNFILKIIQPLNQKLFLQHQIPLPHEHKRLYRTLMIYTLRSHKQASRMGDDKEFYYVWQLSDKAELQTLSVSKLLTYYGFANEWENKQYQSSPIAHLCRHLKVKTLILTTDQEQNHLASNLINMLTQLRSLLGNSFSIWLLMSIADYQRVLLKRLDIKVFHSLNDLHDQLRADGKRAPILPPSTPPICA